MKWKQFAKDYLSFTRKERIGLLALVIIILVVAILPNVLHNQQANRPIAADTAWIAVIKKMKPNDPVKDQRSFDDAEKNHHDYSHDRRADNSSTSISLFEFDPNQIDKAGWEKLGVKDRTIHTILNYLDKGGHFYKAEDLKKIYGLHPDQYARLEPYVKIEGGRSFPGRKDESIRKDNIPNRISYSSIDINEADTTAFIALPGIGSKLATRIVSFRDKLGGFYSIDQIAEVYGLADSVFQKIKSHFKLENIALKKININTATIDELKAHPYIRYNLANPVISYRNEHGPFSKLEDLKKVMAMTDESYNKIAPYLTIQ